MNSEELKVMHEALELSHELQKEIIQCLDKYYHHKEVVTIVGGSLTHLLVAFSQQVNNPEQFRKDLAVYILQWKPKDELVHDKRSGSGEQCQ